MKFILAALLLSTCQTGTGPYSPLPVDPVPFPPEAYDASPTPIPAPSADDACGQAEANAQAHSCLLPSTKNATSWATVCRAYTASGVDMHAGCVTAAGDCPTVAACLSR